MAIQELNEVQRTLVNEVARTYIERLIKQIWEDDMFLAEMGNQQYPILNDTDTLGDGEGGTVARTDAPEMTGQNVAQLVSFVTARRAQVNAAALNALTEMAVRDVGTIVGG